MASPKVLLEWSRVTCASYPGVDIKDMSSFRDGLAFCAIIHKHRPDLISFTSLSKDDVYQNNKLAFEVAETKLGLPALLDPEDLASADAPDPLGVITYISQFYYLFSRKPCAFPSRSRSFHIIKSNKTSDGLKSFKSSADLETSSKERFPPLRSEVVCASCFKPVHLIQRRLSDGRVYHRSCFRCKICSSSLLVDPYTHYGSDTSSLICAHHVKNAPTSPDDLSQQTGSIDNKPRCGFQTRFSGLYSLDGSAITSVPRYAQTAAPQADEEHRSVVDMEGRGEAARTSELSSACRSGTGRPARPVPAPRQSLDSTLVPVPALKIKSAQTPSSSSAAVIRRKVQTDGCVSMEDLQKQKKELDGCLEELEQRGVDLERNIRDGRNGKEEDQRLTEWITLFHERHITLHKDKELVYLIKQQKLEDRQADTEYELRRLLNRPETDWSPEDRGREQQLMDELVTIIEQRNQIISSLDQDVQRENDGDVFWENQISDKDSQKEGLMELKKSKGKFKPAKVFKKLNHRPENSKNSVEKKS
ncbi:MICAL-like protein 1 [Nematolebias whitei]|uniref:MICAL-like protein 1 n=1 Tax=Nematolebias whitei TaxID=451745 RepID=UPI0018994FCC|nr:MICAL-like protein 1 [Nematolebias whitei]